MKNHTFAIGMIVLFASYFLPTTIQDPRVAIDRTESILDERYNANHALESLKYFAQFWRIAGGPGYDSCLSFIEADINSITAGSSHEHIVARFKVLEDQPTGKTWVPEDAILSLESPEARVLHDYSSTPVMLCQNSFPCDVSAPLVYVRGGNVEQHYSQIDVRNQIVLCDVPAANAYRLALKHGAVGVLSCYVPPYNQPQEHPDLIAERGLPYDGELKPFALNVSPRTAIELKERLRSQQVVLRVRVKSSFLERPLKTLEAEIPGAINPEERIVLVAHLDHYKPGANDNASGSAALLEIFRSIVSSIRDGSLQQPARTMTFLWVDEYRGTVAWMSRNPDHLNNIVAAFVLDMVGGDPAKTGGSFRVERMPDPGTVWFRPPDQHSGWGAGSWDKNNLFGSFLNDFILSIIKQRSTRTGWRTASNVWEGGSDHDPFLWRKIPAVLSWHFPDFAYHSSMDQVTNISTAELKNAGVSISTAAYRLALGTEEVAQSVLEIVSAAAAKRLDLLKTQAREHLQDAQMNQSQNLDAVKHQELEIIDAWTEWYDQALDSVVQVPVLHSSHSFEMKISEQRQGFRKTARDVRADLGL
jgi:aminopeptidase YwaD